MGHPMAPYLSWVVTPTRCRMGRSLGWRKWDVFHGMYRTSHGGCHTYNVPHGTFSGMAQMGYIPWYVLHPMGHPIGLLIGCQIPYGMPHGCCPTRCPIVPRGCGLSHRGATVNSEPVFSTMMRVLKSDKKHFWMALDEIFPKNAVFGYSQASRCREIERSKTIAPPVR